jgi:predicted DNA-binding transcriptional regulator AlpA
VCSEIGEVVHRQATWFTHNCDERRERKPHSQAAVVTSKLLTSAMIRKLYYPVSRATFWRKISAGDFPKADVQDGTMNFWKHDTIEQWYQRFTEPHGVN